MNATIAPAEPIRAAAPGLPRPALIGADSPDLSARAGMCSTRRRSPDTCAAGGEPSGGDAARGDDEPPQRPVWPPRGPASTALLTIGRPPRALRV